MATSSRELTKESTESAHPKCHNCQHFYVSWDAAMPRGCRAYNFKSRLFPSAVVLQSSGIPCQFFKPKNK